MFPFESDLIDNIVNTFRPSTNSSKFPGSSCCFSLWTIFNLVEICSRILLSVIQEYVSGVFYKDPSSFRQGYSIIPKQRTQSPRLVLFFSSQEYESIKTLSFCGILNLPRFPLKIPMSISTQSASSRLAPQARGPMVLLHM